MMDAIVQMLRNGLCCIKDLGLFQKTALWDPTVVESFVEGVLGPGALPPPLNKTMPLEALISVLQLYAFFSLLYTGLFVLLFPNRTKIRTIFSLQQTLHEQQKKEDNSKSKKTDSKDTSSDSKSKKTDSKDTSDTSTTKDENGGSASKAKKQDELLIDAVLNASLVRDGSSSIRSVMVGFLVASIGATFFWMVANSWHVTETNWTGGLPALIHSLIVMEIALFFLLIGMIVDARTHLQRATQLQNYIQLHHQQHHQQEPSTKMTTLTGSTDWILLLLQATASWSPSWDIASVSGDDEKSRLVKLLDQERMQLKDILQRYPIIVAQWTDKQYTPQEKKKDDELIALLEKYQQQCRFEGYREYVLFIFNALAFYGYGLCVVIYYWYSNTVTATDVEATNKSMVTTYIDDHINFWYNRSPTDADWYGNFVGDFMWTVEPMVVLSSPLLLQLYRRQVSPRTKTTTTTGTTKPDKKTN